MKRILAGVVAAVAALAGCALDPAAPAPARWQRAVDENNRAERLFAQGDFRAAAEHYQKALAAAESIEDEDAIAANLVNLSIVQQRLGDRRGAIASAERVLGERHLRFSDRRLAEAALRRALLALEAEDAAAAAGYAVRAGAWCGSCPLRGKIASVRGFAALAQGDSAAAESFGRDALGAQRAQGDLEIGDALRLVGLALVLRGEPGQALPLLEEALMHDKQRAEPRAVANDLLALGRANTGVGNHEAARSYYERAIAAASADRNPGVVNQARAEIGRLDASVRRP